MSLTPKLIHFENFSHLSHLHQEGEKRNKNIQPSLQCELCVSKLLDRLKFEYEVKIAKK